MALFFLALYILYFLAVMVLSLTYIDHNRVKARQLLVAGVLAGLFPLGILLGGLLEGTVSPDTIRRIGYFLWLFLPFSVRLVIFSLVYLFRDRGQEGPLPVEQEPVEQ
jgi:predicted MFS family arabinose efflux permease